MVPFFALDREFESLREELLERAHATIAAGGGRYLNRVWGEHEFGGTCVLYLSDVDLGVMGWPAPQTESIPSLTEPLIAKTPVIGFGVMGTLLGINWVIRRRMKLAHEQSGTSDGPCGGPGSPVTPHAGDEQERS